ncbi:hypothetical protein [uncultured Corynebacterium sp.]|nr:hypothetical protein [uncultured Corynebacterium sp.]
MTWTSADITRAFANMPTGGTVLLGVDQRRGFEITGISAPTT